MSSLAPSSFSLKPSVSPLHTSPPSSLHHPIQTTNLHKSSSPTPPTSARVTPSPSDGNSSDGSSNSTPNSPQPDDDDDDEEDDDSFGGGKKETAPLPSFVMKPKGIVERKAAVAAGTNKGSNNSMGAKLARKRADSLKWSRFSGGMTIELGLSNDELSRRS